MVTQLGMVNRARGRTPPPPKLLSTRLHNSSAVAVRLGVSRGPSHASLPVQDPFGDPSQASLTCLANRPVTVPDEAAITGVEGKEIFRHVWLSRGVF